MTAASKPSGALYEKRAQDRRPEFILVESVVYAQGVSLDYLCQSVGPGTLLSGSEEEGPWDLCVGGGHKCRAEELPRRCQEVGENGVRYPREKFPEGRGTQRGQGSGGSAGNTVRWALERQVEEPGHSGGGGQARVDDGQEAPRNRRE